MARSSNQSGKNIEGRVIISYATARDRSYGLPSQQLPPGGFEDSPGEELSKNEQIQYRNGQGVDGAFLDYFIVEPKRPNLL